MTPIRTFRAIRWRPKDRRPAHGRCHRIRLRTKRRPQRIDPWRQNVRQNRYRHWPIRGIDIGPRHGDIRRARLMNEALIAFDVGHTGSRWIEEPKIHGLRPHGRARTGVVKTRNNTRIIAVWHLQRSATEADILTVWIGRGPRRDRKGTGTSIDRSRSHITAFMPTAIGESIALLLEILPQFIGR